MILTEKEFKKLNDFINEIVGISYDMEDIANDTYSDFSYIKKDHMSLLANDILETVKGFIEYTDDKIHVTYNSIKDKITIEPRDDEEEDN